MTLNLMKRTDMAPSFVSQLVVVARQGRLRPLLLLLLLLLLLVVRADTCLLCADPVRPAPRLLLRRRRAKEMSLLLKLFLVQYQLWMTLDIPAVPHNHLVVLALL